MTNNQRFLAELVVLLIIGGAIYAKATPARQNKQVAPKVVRAQKFELVDKDGKTYAILGTGDGKEFGVNSKLTMLSLFSAVGKEKIPGAVMLMSVSDDGSAIFNMGSPVTKAAITLRIGPDGTPDIQLEGKDGKTRRIEP
jgi:hypothetical protein